MDEHIDVDDNDKVGRLYNFLRKVVGRFFGHTATAPLSDFRGVIGGDSFTPEIYQECCVLNRYYGSCVMEIMTRRQQLLKELRKQMRKSKPTSMTRKLARSFSCNAVRLSAH